MILSCQVESTSSQVNQLGGYTGQTEQFADFVHSAARPWAPQRANTAWWGSSRAISVEGTASESAFEGAGELVRACVLAG